jgi:hypothetical protein
VAAPNGSLPAILRVFVGSSLVTLVPLLVWDAAPAAFPASAHGLLAAVPLAAVAVACVLQAVVRRVPRPELGKTCGLAAAFLFWAANQYWPEHPRATLLNDIAVALFVADIVVPWSRWLPSRLPFVRRRRIESGSQPPISEG